MTKRVQGNAESMANALDPSTWAMRVLKNFVRCSKAYDALKGRETMPVNTLIVMVGLPRSGKTTWAKQYAMVEGAPIVSPDAIRLACHGQRYIQLAEPFIWAVAPMMVRALFLAGHRTVIADGCHVSRKRRDEWRADFVVTGWQTMFKHIDTDHQTCLYRAEQEHDREIMPIIDKMTEEFEPLEADEMPLVEYLGAPGDPAAHVNE